MALKELREILKKPLPLKSAMMLKVDEIISANNYTKEDLVQILQDISVEYNYIPRETLYYVSEKLGIPFAEVYSTATFYKAFSLKPRGENIVQVCMGTACHVRGAPRIVEEFERILDIKAGETTDDLAFTLETVNCLGACALGPVVVINGKYTGQMTPGKVGKLLEEYIKPEVIERKKAA